MRWSGVRCGWGCYLLYAVMLMAVHPPPVVSGDTLATTGVVAVVEANLTWDERRGGGGECYEDASECKEGC